MMTPLGPTPADRYMDGFLEGCKSGNDYMESVDAELKALRTKIEVLTAAVEVERKRADRAEAQMVTLAEENAEMLEKLRNQIAEGMRLPR